MENAVELPGRDLAKRVMVVDDDFDFASSLGELIRSHGCDVEMVNTAQAAYQTLDVFLPQLVMIDVRLGRTDGARLLADFIKHPSAPTCIMMTGFASTETAIDAIKTGAYDYLIKPVSPNDLFRTLDRCFDRIRLEDDRCKALYELESRNHDLEQVNLRLHQVVENMGYITGSTSVADLCHRLLDRIASSMGVDGGSIYTREGDQLVLEHSLDPGHAPAVIPMPLSVNSVLGRILDKGEAILVSDAASSDGLMLSGWSGYRDESLLALPLLGEDNSIAGIISLHTKQRPPFTRQDREVCRILLAASSETLRGVKARENLQESQSMLQLIIDAVPECVKVLDKDGNILQMNRAGRNMCEIGATDQIDGACIYQFIHSEYREAVRSLNNQVLNDGISGKMEYVLVGAKGREIWLDTHVVPLRNTLQDIIGVLGVTRDITDSKHEAEIARQQELQLMHTNKMAALGTLVAGVAHEINNPNQTIQINSGLLGHVWEDTMKILNQHVSLHGPFNLGGLQYEGAMGAHSDLINDINVGAEQINAVVSRLQSFSRPYDGIHESVESDQIQINEAVKPALALLRHKIRKSTDNFQINFGDNLPDIKCNRQKLQQIVVNLILNALEALSDKSQGVRVDTRFNTDQYCVELCVIDEGIGIKPEQICQLMEPFYTTKRKQGGTGLGLSIVHSLLKDQDASIHIESEPGKGTRVVVEIPAIKH